jgi:hypothetical protein
MPAGFQSYNPTTGNFQIDGSYKNLAVVRSGTLTPVKDETVFAGPNVYVVDIPVSPSSGEILAVSCESKFTLLWNTNSNAIYRVFGQTPVKYYVFNTNAPLSNYGFQVLNPTTQEVVFDATWKVFNVADIKTSTGVFNYTSGREYAVIFLAQSARRVQTWNWIIPNSVFILRYSYITEMVDISGAQVTILQEEASVVLTQGTPPPTPETFDLSNGLQMKIMILDVTGY